MLVQASQGQFGSAHVVVLGNEKGGSGKSTSALHIAVALMKAGQRVATIDLDCRQQSFTRYIANRSAWARRTGLDLEIPVHYCVKLGETMQIADNENAEFQQFMRDTGPDAAKSSIESMLDKFLQESDKSGALKPVPTNVPDILTASPGPVPLSVPLASNPTPNKSVPN